MATTARQRFALGLYGETCAARHLTGLGMVLLDRNWRGPSGEIDLVLRDHRVLVICEVKTRSSEDYGSPLEAVGAVKARRMGVLACEWAEARGVRPAEIRLDLVGVLVCRGRLVRLEHVRGVG